MDFKEYIGKTRYIAWIDLSKQGVSIKKSKFVCNKETITNIRLVKNTRGALYSHIQINYEHDGYNNRRSVDDTIKFIEDFMCPKKPFVKQSRIDGTTCVICSGFWTAATTEESIRKSLETEARRFYRDELFRLEMDTYFAIAPFKEARRECNAKLGK